MSKSLGNTIAPQDVIKESGAEILRLWVAMSDYTRGAARQQGDPDARRRRLSQAAQHAAAFSWRISTTSTRRRHGARSTRWTKSIAMRWPDTPRPRERMLRAYDAYDFPTVFQTLNTLATVDLSAFYVDVTKDRMYTFGARSRERRSTQTAMYLICDGLARLLAPILPVTADDLWRNMPGHAIARRCTSRSSREVDALHGDPTRRRWDRLLAVREQVNAALEEKRKDKVIGKSLGAQRHADGIGTDRGAARAEPRATCRCSSSSREV